MKGKNHLFTFILSVTFFTMSVVSDEKSQKGTPESTEMLHEPLLKFTSKLYHTIDKQKNAILSPISIHKALGMVLLGADASTQTEKEMIELLGLKGLSKDQINACHNDYSKIVAKFKKITKASQELYKSREQNKNDEDRFHREESKPPILDIFNLVITKDLGDMLPAYSDKVKKYYDSSVAKVDDAKPETKSKLLEQLNSWAKEAGFSQPIMRPDELDRKFAAILLSAIRVQGYWFDEFKEFKDDKAFHNHGKADKAVAGPLLAKSDPPDAKYFELTPLDKAKYKHLHEKMTKSDLSGLFNELTSLNMHVVEIPLQGGLKFTIFEPLHISGSGGELDRLTNELFNKSATANSTASLNNLDKVLRLLDNVDTVTVDHVMFPKFGFENEINLKNALKSLGMNRVFDEFNAEVSGMMTNKVFVEKISHQAMIDVNKFGIKAAGVTKIVMQPLSAMFRPNPIRIKIENPFIFMIRFEKLPLFIGQLVKL